MLSNIFVNIKLNFCPNEEIYNINILPDFMTNESFDYFINELK